MSHSTHPVCGAHGSTRNVVGSGIIRKSAAPSISAIPKPPPGVKTGNAVFWAVSLASSVVVIEQPLRIAAAASPAITVLPRRMPCWSGNDSRTTSSRRCSIAFSALTAASNCSSFHSPWRSTKLCATLSSGDDTGAPLPGRRWSIYRRSTRAASMQARGLRLQAREQLRRSLHRQALVIEAQAVEAAQLLAGAGAAGAAVIALRHDDAVAGVRARDRGIDREDAPMARPDRAHHAGEEILVLAVDRGDERAAAAPDQRHRILFVAIGHDGGGGAEHLDLVHRGGRARVLELEQGRRHECRLALVDAVKRGRLNATAHERGFGGQPPDAIERRRLLAARHHRTHAGVGEPRIAHLGALEL